MSTSARAWRAWLPEAVAVAVLLVVHGASLGVGQLRGDDFQFLREARESIGDVLLRPWGGHVLPLWRLEAAAAWHAWGLDPVPYRWWLFAQVAAVCVLQLRVLAAWGVGRDGRLLAAVMLGAWAQWSQVLAGYWTLSISVKVWIFTLVAVLGVLREGAAWARRGLVAAGVLLAVLADPAGVIVIPAVAGAFLLRRNAFRDPQSRDPQSRDPLGGWILAVLLVSAGVVAFGQAFVRVAGTGAGDLGALGGGSRAAVAAYLAGPVSVGAAVAPVLATRIPPAVLGPVSWLLALAMVAAIALTWRAAGPTRPAVSHAALMLTVGVGLLAVTRAYGDYQFMAGWTHYVTYLFLPVVALAATAWDTWRERWPGARRAATLAAATGVALVAQVAGGAVASWLGLSGGPAWEREMARARTQAYATIVDSMLRPIAAAVPYGATVPQLPSDHLTARFPREHPFFPLSFYSALGGLPPDRFRWATPPMPAWIEVGRHDAQVATDLRRVTDPAFLRSLERPSWWRDTYFIPVDIPASAVLPVACDVARRRGAGAAANPARAHLLLVLVDAPRPGSVRLDVRFATSFRAVAAYGVIIAPGQSGCLALDLRAVPELALSNTVRLLGVSGAVPAQITVLGIFPPGARSGARYLPAAVGLAGDRRWQRGVIRATSFPWPHVTHRPRPLP